MSPVYVNHGSAEVDALIRDAKAQAARICETCDLAGALQARFSTN
jgi:hypothetical protein